MLVHFGEIAFIKEIYSQYSRIDKHTLVLKLVNNYSNDQQSQKLYISQLYILLFYVLNIL